jgi:hypothetical protein
MVSDPTNSTREGDLVALEGGRRISRHVRHVIAGVIAPMGPPMTERPTIPSAVERLAAVEAKRATKDIRQAARGRWPAIVRVREREAREASDVEDVQVNQEAGVWLDKFVKVFRRRRQDLDVHHFLHIAGYTVLQGEVPLEAQSAALREARTKLREEVSKLESHLDRGTTKRTGQELTIFEREQLAKDKLERNRRIDQLTRSISHLHHYVKQTQPEGEKEKLKKDPIEWYDLVKALSLNRWEQNIAALDLFGAKRVAKAREIQLEKVLMKAGLHVQPAESIKTADVGTGAATLLGGEPETVETAALSPAEEEEQASVETQVGGDAIMSRPDSSGWVEDAGLKAQREEAQSLSYDDKKLPPTGDEPGTGLPNERAQKNIHKAQDYLERDLENEAQVGEKTAKVSSEDVEVSKEKNAGGFWRLFKR